MHWILTIMLACNTPTSVDITFNNKKECDTAAAAIAAARHSTPMVCVPAITF